MEIHHVIGGGGLRLHVRDWGPRSAPPIVFIHGWSQCHMCWSRQYESTLADEFRLAAFDLRGHGMSQAPLEEAHYTDSRLWADDLHAVMDGLDLRGPILVAWSYGGYVVCDYLRFYGQSDIAGIVFVGAAVRLNPAAFGSLIGPAFLDHVPGAAADDLPTNIETMRSFVRACTARPLPAEDFEAALCWNMVVPPQVRGALAARELDNGDVLRGLTLPILVTHGREDRVVLPNMSETVLADCPQAKASWYEAVGHVPQIESSERFNNELAAFASRVWSGASAAPRQAPGDREAV
jgi:non-heme chloroperoxidase